MTTGNLSLGIRRNCRNGMKSIIKAYFSHDNQITKIAATSTDTHIHIQMYNYHFNRSCTLTGKQRVLLLIRYIIYTYGNKNVCKNLDGRMTLKYLVSV